MSITKTIKTYIKKNIKIRKFARKVHFFIYKTKYQMKRAHYQVDENMILFACFNGRSYCDSPKAIYQYLVNNPAYANYQFVWAFKDVEKHSFLEKNHHTKVINIQSNEFKVTLAKAKYWVLNFKINDYIFPKKEQVFVQCWHGTPLKRLGCDLQHFDNAMNSVSEVRKRYRIETAKMSYFLSPSDFATEKFISAWNLEKCHKQDIILQKGYPRNDFLHNYQHQDIIRIKENLKIKENRKKIILYAPTYRDNQHSTDIGYTYRTEVDFDYLQKELQDDYIILFRAHWLVAQSFDFEKYKDFIIDVSNYDDINELYVIADMLITDYSSVFFDYANLKRPIIFYMYDLEQYRDDIRGFYLDIHELPGNIIRNEQELIQEIKTLTNHFEWNEQYQKFNQKFNYLDDGQAAKRVVEEIFNNKEEDE